MKLSTRCREKAHVHERKCIWARARDTAARILRHVCSGVFSRQFSRYVFSPYRTKRVKSPEARAQICTQWFSGRNVIFSPHVVCVFCALIFGEGKKGADNRWKLLAWCVIWLTDVRVVKCMKVYERAYTWAMAVEIFCRVNEVNDPSVRSFPYKSPLNYSLSTFFVSWNQLTVYRASVAFLECIFRIIIFASS